nr:hypothetical protein [Enterocloster clostridioformis]
MKTKPRTDGEPWLLWQYTNRQRLDGYEGDETFIDMNVFYGSRDSGKTGTGIIINRKECPRLFHFLLL